MEIENKKKCGEIVRELILFFLLVIGVFLIQANITWVNPSPGYGPRLILSNKIPILWQYQGDAYLEFATAIYFPQIFHKVPDRVSRPVYPGIAKILGNGFEYLLSPAVKVNPIIATIVGYMALKIFMYALFCFLQYKLLCNFMSNHYAFLSVLLILFHSHAITYSVTYGTQDLEFINPLIICYLFFDITRRYSHKKNVLYSLIIGVLFLAKENYAVYIAIMIFSLYKREYKKISMSVCIHFIPLIIWFIFLKFYGLSYYHHAIDGYNVGTWLYKEFIFMHPFMMLKTIQDSIISYIRCLSEFYTVWLFVSVYALGVLIYKNSISKHVVFFLWVFVVFHWFQMFVVKVRYLPYMASDLEFIIFGLTAYSLGTIIDRYFKNSKTVVVAIIGILWLGWNILSIAQFPWIHPYNQIGSQYRGFWQVP